MERKQENDYICDDILSKNYLGPWAPYKGVNDFQGSES